MLYQKRLTNALKSTVKHLPPQGTDPTADAIRTRINAVLADIPEIHRTVGLHLLNSLPPLNIEVGTTGFTSRVIQRDAIAVHVLTNLCFTAREICNILNSKEEKVYRLRNYPINEVNDIITRLTDEHRNMLIQLLNNTK